jgi:hypothetical protein
MPIHYSVAEDTIGFGCTASKRRIMSLKPLIVPVHGVLTDASVWNSVAEQLQRNGYTTLAPAIPLRGLHADAEYLSSILTTVEGCEQSQDNATVFTSR